MLKAKTYFIYEEKHLYNNKRYFLKDKIKIECIGGDSMNEEKEIVFLNPDEIPQLTRNAGRNWSDLFDQIPNGKVLAMTEKKYGSAPNIRAQVAKYNKVKKNGKLKANGRTDKKTETVTIYVQRLEAKQ